MDLVRRGYFLEICHCPETSRDANGSADIIDKVLSNVAGESLCFKVLKPNRNGLIPLCLFGHRVFILFNKIVTKPSRTVN